MTIVFFICLGVAVIALLVQHSKNKREKQRQEEEQRRARIHEAMQPSVRFTFGSPAPVTPRTSPPAAKPAETKRPSGSYSSDTKTETHIVAGTSYRQQDIEELGYPNPDYDLTAKELKETYDPGERVYKYEFSVVNCKLVPEPDNAHDKNAVRVEADGIHIGYIKADSAARVRKLLDEGKVAWSTIDIYGGPVKELEEDDDGKTTIVKSNNSFGAKITLHIRK